MCLQPKKTADLWAYLYHSKQEWCRGCRFTPTGFRCVAGLNAKRRLVFLCNYATCLCWKINAHLYFVIPVSRRVKRNHIDLPVGEVLKVVIYVEPTRGLNKADNKSRSDRSRGLWRLHFDFPSAADSAAVLVISAKYHCCLQLQRTHTHPPTHTQTPPHPPVAYLSPAPAALSY